MKQFDIFLYTAAVAVFAVYFYVSAAGNVFTAPKVVYGRIQGQKSEKKKQSPLTGGQVNIFRIENDVFVVQPGTQAVEGARTFPGKLTGVIVGSTPEDCKAIVVLGGEIYVLSYNISQNGMLLKAADNNSALINYSGTDYNLIIYEGLASRPSPVSRADADPSVSGSTVNISVERSEILGILDDVNAILTGILISPYYLDGEFQGYRVAELADTSPVRLIGIERGDIINRLNGDELKSPEILFNMMKDLDDLSAVTVDVTRGGQKITILLDIR